MIIWSHIFRSTEQWIHTNNNHNHVPICASEQALLGQTVAEGNQVTRQPRIQLYIPLRSFIFNIMKVYFTTVFKGTAL